MLLLWMKVTVHLSTLIKYAAYYQVIGFMEGKLYFFRLSVSIYFELHLPPLAPNICCILLSNPFASVICHDGRRKQFLLRIWPIQLTFLLRILFRSVLFSLIPLKTCSLVTFSDHTLYNNNDDDNDDNDDNNNCNNNNNNNNNRSGRNSLLRAGDCKLTVGLSREMNDHPVRFKGGL